MKHLKKKLDEHDNDTAYYFEQILLAVANKTATVWPLTSYLAKHQS